MENIFGNNSTSIATCIFFPKNAEVTFEITELDYVTYETKVIYKETKSPKGFECEFKKPDEFYDNKNFTIEVSCKGFKTAQNYGAFR